MNGRQLFDTFGMTEVNPSVVAGVPQLLWVMQTGGKSEARVCHLHCSHGDGQDFERSLYVGGKAPHHMQRVDRLEFQPQNRRNPHGSLAPDVCSVGYIRAGHGPQDGLAAGIPGRSCGFEQSRLYMARWRATCT